MELKRTLLFVFAVSVCLRLVIPVYIWVSEGDAYRFMLSDYPHIVYQCASDIADRDGYPVVKKHLMAMNMVNSKIFNTVLASVPISIHRFFSDPDRSVEIVLIQVMQAVIDSFGCILIFMIMYSLFPNQKRLPIISSMVYAFWPPSIFYSYHLLGEAYIPLIVLSIGYFVSLGVMRNRRGYFVVSGLFFALLFLIRIDNALIFPFVVLYLIWHYRKRYFEGVCNISLLVCTAIVSYLISMNSMVYFLDIGQDTIAEMRTEYLIKHPDNKNKFRADISWFAIGQYNMLAEYPGCYKGLRSGNDWASSAYLKKKVAHYKNSQDKVFETLLPYFKTNPEVLVGIRELIIGKPVLYVNRVIQRLWTYSPSHPYLACFAYFFSEPKEKFINKPAHWRMLGYRYSQVFQGVKYIDYLLFFLFCVGVWQTRHNKYMPIFLCIYIGVLTGHAGTMVGEFYFRVDKEWAIINPKYLLGMVSIWPIFIPIGLLSIKNKITRDSKPKEVVST